MSTPVMVPCFLEIQVARSGSNGMATMRRAVIWSVGVAALVGGFLTTLWLTEPIPQPNIETTAPNKGAAILAAYLVPDEGILSAAAKAAGLQASDKLNGYIDEVTRLNKDQVKIAGWAADTIGQGTPITVLVFADG